MQNWGSVPDGQNQNLQLTEPQGIHVCETVPRIGSARRLRQNAWVMHVKMQISRFNTSLPRETLRARNLHFQEGPGDLVKHWC